MAIVSYSGLSDTLYVAVEASLGPGSSSIGRAVSTGWNMMGLPVDAPNRNYRALFPGAIESTLFEFSGSYTAPTGGLLTPGTGYWLRFESPSTAVLSGTPVGAQTLSLEANWNLISGPNCEVPISSVSDPEGILMGGTLFGFDGSYIQATDLVPGYGYWIRTSEAGSVTLSCAQSSGVPSGKWTPLALDALSDFGRLDVEDERGHSRSLYFGAPHPDGIDIKSFELPPRPSRGAFDVRFGNGASVNSETDEVTIYVEQGTGDVSIRLAALPKGRSIGFEIAEYSGEGDEIARYFLGVGQSIVLNPSTHTLQLRSTDSPELPTEFTLEQNYPNPFNPVTTIRFDLPEATDVPIEVFDVLGRRVYTLLQADRMDAGSHQVRFDASRLASGLYLYQFRAGSFNKIRQMVVLK